MPVVTEVMDTRQVDIVNRYTDIFQIGARNMQNFNLLSEVGQTRKPVLLKRGMSAGPTDLLMSAEYIMAQGNKRVILCERGDQEFRQFDAQPARPGVGPQYQGIEPSAIIVDPSHATGRRI